MEWRGGEAVLSGELLEQIRDPARDRLVPDRLVLGHRHADERQGELSNHCVREGSCVANPVTDRPEVVDQRGLGLIGAFKGGCQSQPKLVLIDQSSTTLGGCISVALIGNQERPAGCVDPMDAGGVDDRDQDLVGPQSVAIAVAEQADPNSTW